MSAPKNAEQDGQKRALKEGTEGKKERRKNNNSKAATAAAATDPPEGATEAPETKASTPPSQKPRATPAGDGDQPGVQGGSAGPPPSPGFPWFRAVCLACFGGTAGLTKVAAGRAGSAAKSLRAAGYTPEEITEIAAWVRHKDASWRTDLSPQALEGEAPKWRAAQATAPGPDPSDLIALEGGGYYDPRTDAASPEYDSRFDPESPDFDPEHVLSA